MGKPKGVLAAAVVSAVLLTACSSLRPSSASSSPIEVFPKITQSAPRLPFPVASAHFPRFFEAAAAGPLVPGLLEGAVPQGLAWAPTLHLYLISCYFDASTPSAVMAIDRASGMLSKTTWLASSAGEPLHGHVGGIAADRQSIWIASDTGVYRYATTDFDAASDGALLRAKTFLPTPVTASAATFADGMLWVGEFAYYGPGTGQYHTDPSHHLATPNGEQNHALVAGYRVDGSTGLFDPAAPEALISIPDRVQGMAFVGSKVFLSVSFGRRNDSVLEEYRNPVSDRPAGTLAIADARTAPYWLLERASRTNATAAPPMMEGIVPVDDRLFMLFESGAEKYRYSGRDSVAHLYSIAVQ